MPNSGQWLFFFDACEQANDLIQVYKHLLQLLTKGTMYNLCNFAQTEVFPYSSN